jgi:hypothetical protein
MWRTNRSSLNLSGRIQSCATGQVRAPGASLGVNVASGGRGIVSGGGVSSGAGWISGGLGLGFGFALAFARFLGFAFFLGLAFFFVFFFGKIELPK